MNLAYKKYLTTKDWEVKSEACKLAAGYKCEICGSEKHLHAHHLNYSRVGNELQEDLQCLCEKCHSIAHGRPIGRVKTGGMRMVWVNSLTELLEDIITSNLDYRVVAYITRNQGQSGFIKGHSGDPVSINELASMFEVTREKISKLVKKLIGAGIVKKHKRTLYINPYLILPYGNSQEDNYILQLMWDNDYAMTREEILKVHSTEITTDREVEL